MMEEEPTAVTKIIDTNFSNMSQEHQSMVFPDVGDPYIESFGSQAEGIWG